MFFRTSRLPTDQFSDGKQDFLSEDLCLNSTQTIMKDL